MINKKFIIYLLLIILLSISLISCSKQVVNTTITKVAEETTSKYPDIVKLTLDGERKGSDILFYGTTNLPDGVLLAYNLDITKQGVISYPLGDDRNLIIKDGKYSVTVSDVPDGIVKVWVCFSTIVPPDKQPQGAIDKYGENGEKIKGDNLTVFKFTDGEKITRIELIKDIQ